MWVTGPGGAPWEVYTVKDDDPAHARPASASLEILGDGGCCTAGSGVAQAPTGQEAGACCS